MDEQQRLAALSRCRLFPDVGTDHLALLAAAASTRRYRRGQVVFAEGDAGDSLVVVTEGRLKAYSHSTGGEEFLLAVVGPGESLGELALADGGPRSATVAALTDAAVLRLTRESVLSIAATSPALSAALLSELAAVVRRITDTAADLVFLDLPRRVAKLVLDMRAASSAAVIDLHLTQSEIGSRVGASRQSVNSALREFQSRGWIHVDGQQMSIRNPAELMGFVGD